MTRTLFVTWDGPAQNYMEALFFPIFARAQQLATLPLHIGIMQFTWTDAASRARIAQSAAAHSLSYCGHDAVRRPRQLAVPAMIAYGAARLIQEIDRGRWDTLMPRSIIPAAMCLLAIKARPHTRLIFDADGLMADERVDFAGWSASGAQYRLFRDWEAQTLRRAQSVIVRSLHARRILAARAGAGFDERKIHVIPNAKDPHHFTPLSAAQRATTRDALNIPQDAPLLAYAGSLGPQYHPRAMLATHQALLKRAPNAHLLVLSGMSEVMQDLLKALEPHERAQVIIKRCSSAEVASLLAAADVGLSLRQPSFSQQAVCPIKIAEYLLCGLPVVMLRGVGDLDERLTGCQALHVMEDVSEAQIERAADWVIQDVLGARASRLSEQAREAGLAHFALDSCAHQLAALLCDVSQALS